MLTKLFGNQQNKNAVRRLVFLFFVLPLPPVNSKYKVILCIGH